MKLFAFALIAPLVLGSQLRSGGSDAAVERKQGSRFLQWFDFSSFFNPCDFFINIFLNGDGLDCGCGLNLFQQNFGLQCKTKFCTGSVEGIDNICFDPELELDWQFAGQVETGVCTPTIDSVNMKFADEGGKIEEVNFDMPSFCMNITAIAGIIPTMTACQANLGNHQCTCRLCDSGVDIEIDCSGTTELPENIQQMADFGCVGVSSIFAAFDASGTQSTAFNPFFLMDGVDITKP